MTCSRVMDLCFKVRSRGELGVCVGGSVLYALSASHTEL
jgi:hypothetical protein